MYFDCQYVHALNVCSANIGQEAIWSPGMDSWESNLGPLSCWGMSPAPLPPFLTDEWI